MTLPLVTNVIGIDCATDPRKVGIAKGVVSESKLTLEDISSGEREGSVAEVVSSWIGESRRVLLALDAPLGWSQDMGRHLVKHRAGQVLRASPNRMFRRTTDRLLKTRIGKQPLDVGADRIARTAHAALSMLNELRTLLSLSLPLAWNKHFQDSVAVIEVYPAGTLTAYGFRASGYKEKAMREEREKIVRSLSRQMKINNREKRLMVENADVLDAAVCLLAGRDFLVGNVIEPEDRDIAEKEGWIWVKDRG